MRARWLLLALTVGGCRLPQPASRSSGAELAAREQRLTTRRATAAKESMRSMLLARWILPPDLGEISGLALTSDGRLLAHNDERGRVSVIDPRRGVLLKRFTIGTKGTDAHDDFEGITVAEGKIWMVASTGLLYEFTEGANGERVSYGVHDTRLGHQCEFEGVAFDSASGSLLLPCKTVGAKELRDKLVLYRWSLRGTEGAQSPPLAIPLRLVIGANPWKGLHPSDITVDPATGNYVLIAGQESALIEITPSGAVVRAVPLPGKHRQAEGVAVLPEGILVVSDEAANRVATLTLYRWPLASVAGPP